MPDTQLNPDALANLRLLADRATEEVRHAVIEPDILHKLLDLAVAQPEVNSVEELVTTRVGLALANAAFKEGLSAGIRACNESLEGEPFVKPVSPYSAPLLAMIKSDRPEVKP